MWHGKGIVKIFCKMATFFFIFFFFFFFNFKIFSEFVKVLLQLFMFWLFGHEACGILAP